MKARSLFLALLTLGILSWSCNKSEDSSTFKSSINSNLQQLSAALSKISASTGYQVLSDGAYLKSATDSPVDSLLTNQILLSDILGVYDYKMPSLKRGPIVVQRYFNKTADSSQMVVRMPEEKVKNCKTMFTFSAKDTALVNNYVISLSEYQYKFKQFVGFDYVMASSIKIKDVDAGVLKIHNSNNYVSGASYNSEFAFANGYNIKYVYSSGDTAVSSYSITSGPKILYEEKYTAIKTKSDYRHREREFSLTIGDVQIIRKMGVKNSLDSAKVYVAGVLQPAAKVVIVDKTTDVTDVTLTSKKRELQITFEDGTKATYSQLAGAAVDNITTLFASMRQVYFATDVVDWIAWDVYKHKK